MFDEATSPSATERQTGSDSALAEEDVTPEAEEDVARAVEPVVGETETPPQEDPAVARFTSCRWHATQEGDGAAYCSHRDVQPYAGMNGFKPDAWCVDCEFFKVRRTVKKRSKFDIDDDY